jgi:hypothetical protein
MSGARAARTCGQEDLPRRDTRQSADERGGHRRSGAEQQGQQHDRDEDADELADRRVLLGGQVDQDPAGLHLDFGFSRLTGGDQRLAVFLGDLALAERVAHIDGGQPAVGGHLPPGRERVRDQRDAVEGADLRERALDRGPGRGIRDLALVDREHQRGVHAAERRGMGLEEVDGFLRLRSGDRVVVGGVARARGCQDQQDQDEDSAGEAALPMYGEGARGAREEQGHTSRPTAGRRSR